MMRAVVDRWTLVLLAVAEKPVPVPGSGRRRSAGRVGRWVEKEKRVVGEGVVASAVVGGGDNGGYQKCSSDSCP